MRWFLIAPVVLLALGVLMYLFGLLRPGSHTARMRSRLSSPPEEVWAVVADHEHWAEWMPGFRRIELLPGGNGTTTLIAEGSWGEMPMRIEVFEPPIRMVTFLDGGTFSGRWTWELEPTPEGGTLVTVTEQGEIGNPFFRTMAILNDNHRSLRRTQKALAERLGETATPEKVD